MEEAKGQDEEEGEKQRADARTFRGGGAERRKKAVKEKAAEEKEKAASGVATRQEGDGNALTAGFFRMTASYEREAAQRRRNYSRIS